MRVEPAYDPVYDLFDPRVMADPYPHYARLRDEHPLHYNERLDHYVLSRYDDVLSATRNPKIYSSAQGLTPIKNEIDQLGLAPTFIMMDPPDHSRLRRLITSAFTPETIRALEPKVRQFVGERFEAMKRKSADAVPLDLIDEVASPLPTMVVADILGVPAEDRGKFDPWSDALVAATADFAPEVEQAIDAVQALFQYFGQMCQARRAEPRDDMISKLIAAEVDGERLQDWDILGFCFVMIAGGNDTTTNNLGNAMRWLDRYPDQRRELIDEPQLIANAVDELLRIDAPVQGLSRTTTEPVTIHDATIPAGAKVHLLYASANRDPRHWGEDADELNIHRRIDRHMSFTQGPHFCIGAHVAKLMARVFFEELFGRFGERYDVDWERAERRQSAFTRGYVRMPIVLQS